MPDINDMTDDERSKTINYFIRACHDFKRHSESSPEGDRSNDLIGEREHVSEREAVPGGDQGVESEASTRAIGAESEQLLMPCTKYLVDLFWLGAEIGTGNSSLRGLTKEQYFELNKKDWTERARCLINYIRAGRP